MKIGTRSLLFGVHQFLVHPVVVTLAWRRCYHRWPRWHEIVAIVLHDWGYWGCPNMDGREGLVHPIPAARWACMVAGERAGRLVLFHSGKLSRILSHEPSALYLPDKVSVLFEPRWFYLLRGLASGEVWEYIRVNAPPELSRGRWRPWRWLNWYRSYVKALLMAHNLRESLAKDLENL